VHIGVISCNFVVKVSRFPKVRDLPIMKRKLLLIALVCFSAVCAAAQQPAPLTPAADDPQGWKEYSYKDDNIRFRFPAEPKVTVDQRKNERSYTSGAFELTVSPAGIDIGKDPGAQKRYLILLSMSFDQIIESSGSKLIKREEATIDGMPAMFIQYESKDGLVTRAKMFVIGEKVYAAQAESQKSEKNGANREKDFEKSVMTFLDSIHLISK
jgi:hypothetical protein